MLYHGQGVYSLIMPHLPMEMITGLAFKHRLICQEKWSTLQAHELIYDNPSLYKH